MNVALLRSVKVCITLRGNRFRREPLIDFIEDWPARVSIPLRGNRFRSWTILKNPSKGSTTFVSIPLRGNRFRSYESCYGLSW